MEETINDEIIRQADDVPWMATTAAHRPELVHSLGALPLRPVQVLPTRDPWLPVVSREVRALGLSSLVLFRRRRGGASCRCGGGHPAQAVSGRRASDVYPDGRGCDAHHQS